MCVSSSPLENNKRSFGHNADVDELYGEDNHREAFSFDDFISINDCPNYRRCSNDFNQTVAHLSSLVPQFYDLQRLNQYDGEGDKALVTGEYNEADCNLTTSASPLFQPFKSSGSTDDGQDVLRIFYQNVRGLRTKLDDVYLAVLENDYDVYVLTETWLDSRFNSLQLFGDDYTVFRTDRNLNNSVRKRGGGVLIAVSTSFVCCRIADVVPDSLETLLVKIVTGTQNVFIAVLYIPPEKRLDCDIMQAQLDVFASTNSRMRMYDAFLAIGDFNQPNVVWKKSAQGFSVADPLDSVFTPASRMLLDGAAFLGLRQINAVCNHQLRCLDLVFVNDDCCHNCHVSEAPETIVSLDPFHPALCVKLTTRRPVQFSDESSTIQPDFRRTNVELLRNLLSQVDWSALDRLTDIDDAVAFYNQMVSDCVLIAVPPRQPPKKPPWTNAKLRFMKRTRAKALRAYTNQRCPFRKHTFTIASNEYRNYNKFLYNCYVRHAQYNLQQNQ